MSKYRFMYLHEDDEGFDCEEDVEVPGKYEVCDRCRGENKHTKPGIDDHGLSFEDFAEDPDFEEDYFAGVYDVVCERCKGLRVVVIPDLDRCTEEQRRKVEAHLDEKADIRHERVWEQRLRRRGIEY